MAKSDYIKALIRSHAEGDEERFYAIAMQVAAQEARQGHTRFAQELRDLVDEARTSAIGSQSPADETGADRQASWRNSRTSHSHLSEGAACGYGS